MHRPFNWTAPPAAARQVWLSIGNLGQAAQVRLNGHSLGQVSGSRPAVQFDITRLLQSRNVLTVSLEAGESHGRESFSEPDVQLRIREHAEEQR